MYTGENQTGGQYARHRLYFAKICSMSYSYVNISKVTPKENLCDKQKGWNETQVTVDCLQGKASWVIRCALITLAGSVV
jgi:hypothetical protein